MPRCYDCGKKIDGADLHRVKIHTSTTWGGRGPYFHYRVVNLCTECLEARKRAPWWHKLLWGGPKEITKSKRR